MRPIPTAATFAAIREAYFAAKAADDQSPDPHDDKLRTALQQNASGSAAVGAALEIRVSRFGRGLFAAQALTRGQRVYESTRYGLFGSEAQWRRFLQLLPSDELRYDVHLWSYVPIWDESLVAIDLDEGSLMNHGVLTTTSSSSMSKTSESDAATSSPFSTHGEHTLCSDITANVQYCGETYCYLVTKDLDEGDEILCDYSSFHEPQHALTWYNESWDDFVGKEESY
jgi:hypothetical protein